MTFRTRKMIICRSARYEVREGCLAKVWQVPFLYAGARMELQEGSAICKSIAEPSCLFYSSSSSSSTATAADAVVMVIATEITATMMQRRIINASITSPVESFI